MSKHSPSRRQVLKGGLATIALGSAVGLAGCGKPRDRAGDQPAGSGAAERAPDLRADMSVLVLALGPWQERDRSVAERFIERYASAERMAAFETDAPVLHALALRFPEAAMAVDDIDLSTYSAAERALFLRFADDLYTISELRYFIVGHQPPGVCAA
jgi:hypothetical protein